MPIAWEEKLQQEQNRLHMLVVDHSMNALLEAIPSALKAWESAPDQWYGAFVLQTCQLLNTPRPEVQQTKWNLAEATLQTKAESLPLPITLQLLYQVVDKPLITSKEWPENRLAFAEIWLKAWQQLEQEMNPAFDPTQLPNIKVAPPDETGLPPGVSPDAIDDPQLRATYQKAIKANRVLIEQYTYQNQLLQMAPSFQQTASQYLIHLYSQVPVDIAELQQLLLTYVGNTSAVEAILLAITK
ncbi:MAG: hypothetical protein AAF598_15975 [Bacteroidota bacterium]